MILTLLDNNPTYPSGKTHAIQRGYGLQATAGVLLSAVLTMLGDSSQLASAADAGGQPERKTENGSADTDKDKNGRIHGTNNQKHNSSNVIHSNQNKTLNQPQNQDHDHLERTAGNVTDSTTKPGTTATTTTDLRLKHHHKSTKTDTKKSIAVTKQSVSKIALKRKRSDLEQRQEDPRPRHQFIRAAVNDRDDVDDSNDNGDEDDYEGYMTKSAGRDDGSFDDASAVVGSGGVSVGVAGGGLSEHRSTDEQQENELESGEGEERECVAMEPCLLCDRSEMEFVYCKETGRRQEVRAWVGGRDFFVCLLVLKECAGLSSVTRKATNVSAATKLGVTRLKVMFLLSRPLSSSNNTERGESIEA